MFLEVKLLYQKFKSFWYTCLQLPSIFLHRCPKTNLLDGTLLTIVMQRMTNFCAAAAVVITVIKIIIMAPVDQVTA